MRRPYRKLNLDERRILATMLQAKATKTKIAETLGRYRSTIHREIKRNCWHDTEVPQADGYWHVTAQTLADRRYLKGLNNRLEGSHRPTPKREKLMGRFKSPRQAQKFLADHDQINAIFRPRRYRLSAKSYHHARTDAFHLWHDHTIEMAA